MASPKVENDHAATKAEDARISLVPTLNDIPSEIILDIADHLPASNRAILSLSTKRMFDVLNPKALRGIQNNKIYQERNGQQRINFLYLYSMDHTKYFACHDCKVLHLTKLVKEPREVHSENHKYKLPCMKNGSNFNPSVLGGYYRINHAHVGLALRQECLGTEHGIPLSAFKHQEYRHATPAVPANLFSVEARVIHTTNMRPRPASNVGLAIRSQQIFLMQPDTRWELLTVRSFGPLCEHVHNQSVFPLPQNGISGIHSAAAWQTTNLTFEEIFNNGHQALLGCTKCDLAAIIIAYPRPPLCYPYVSITRWTNLGTGQFKDDGIWNIHQHDKGSSRACRGASIQFEIAQGINNIALLKKNLAYLKSTPVPSHGWFKRILVHVGILEIRPPRTSEEVWGSKVWRTYRSVTESVSKAVSLKLKRHQRPGQ